MKCSRDTIYISKFVFFLVFDIVHNFFYPHFPIRFRHPQVSGPRFTDTPIGHDFLCMLLRETSLSSFLPHLLPIAFSFDLSSAFALLYRTENANENIHKKPSA